MLKRFDQKSAGAASGIENRFAKFRIDHCDHEPDNRSRRIKLTRVASSIAHFAQHRFVERAERVKFLGRTEMNSRNLVDHVTQQVAVDHPIDRAFEHGRDHVATIAAVASAQTPQISK